MPDDDRYFDLAGLAKYSGLSVSTLRRYLTDTDNPIPNYHVRPSGKERGRVLVYKRDFDLWVRGFAEKHARPAVSDISDVSWIRRAFDKHRKE